MHKYLTYLAAMKDSRVLIKRNIISHFNAFYASFQCAISRSSASHDVIKIAFQWLNFLSVSTKAYWPRLVRSELGKNPSLHGHSSELNRAQLSFRIKNELMLSECWRLFDKWTEEIAVPLARFGENWNSQLQNRSLAWYASTQIFRLCYFYVLTSLRQLF